MLDPGPHHRGSEGSVEIRSFKFDRHLISHEASLNCAVGRGQHRYTRQPCHVYHGAGEVLLPSHQRVPSAPTSKFGVPSQKHVQGQGCAVDHADAQSTQLFAREYQKGGFHNREGRPLYGRGEKQMGKGVCVSMSATCPVRTARRQAGAIFKTRPEPSRQRATVWVWVDDRRQDRRMGKYVSHRRNQ